MTNHLAKRVSNYELFFDLAFVLAISQLTSSFHIENIGRSELLAFVTTILIMLNIWNNESFYYNKYGDSRGIDIYSVIILMLWVGNFALSFRFDFNYILSHPENVRYFNIFLILSYLTIASQYFLKGRKLGFNPDIKKNIMLLILYSIPILPVALGILPYRDWTVPLYLLPLAAPFFYRSSKHITPMNFPHALERNQLLTIITFGEGVIAIVKTYPLTTYPLEGTLFFIGMGLMFAFYIAQTFINIDHHHTRSVSQLFYAHTFIIMNLLFFTVGIEFIADSHHHDLGIRFLILSIFGYYGGVLATAYYNQRLYSLNRPILMMYGITLLIASILLFLTQRNIPLFASILVIMVYTTNYISIFHRKKACEANNIPQPDSKKNPRDFS